jgi:L-ascorbate metabolism protein UlaG (beta-lactamase superfamily)
MVLVFIFACNPISISKKRNQNNHTLVINKEFKITSLQPIYLNYGVYRANFYQSGFRINYRDLVIYIDPVMLEKPTKADYIFITHPHVDHFSIKDIDKIYKENTLIIGPTELEKKIKDYRFQSIKPNKKIDLGKFICETIPAYNIKKHKMGLALHPRKKNYLGYVLTFNDIKIYHAGDTDYILDMNLLKHVTVALIPIGEWKTAMTPYQAARAVNSFKPTYVIPMHYKLNNGAEKKFKDSLNPLIKIELLQ